MDAAVSSNRLPLSASEYGVGIRKVESLLNGAAQRPVSGKKPSELGLGRLLQTAGYKIPKVGPKSTRKEGTSSGLREPFQFQNLNSNHSGISRSNAVLMKLATQLPNSQSNLALFGPKASSPKANIANPNLIIPGPQKDSNKYLRHGKSPKRKADKTLDRSDKTSEKNSDRMGIPDTILSKKLADRSGNLGASNGLLKIATPHSGFLFNNLGGGSTNSPTSSSGPQGIYFGGAHVPTTSTKASLQSNLAKILTSNNHLTKILKPKPQNSTGIQPPEKSAVSKPDASKKKTTFGVTGYSGHSKISMKTSNSKDATSPRVDSARGQPSNPMISGNPLLTNLQGGLFQSGSGSKLSKVLAGIAISAHNGSSRPHH